MREYQKYCCFTKTKSSDINIRRCHLRELIIIFQNQKQGTVLQEYPTTTTTTTTTHKNNRIAPNLTKSIRIIRVYRQQENKEAWGSWAIIHHNLSRLGWKSLRSLVWVDAISSVCHKFLHFWLRSPPPTLKLVQLYKRYEDYDARVLSKFFRTSSQLENIYLRISPIFQPPRPGWPIEFNTRQRKLKYFDVPPSIATIKNPMQLRSLKLLNWSWVNSEDKLDSWRLSNHHDMPKRHFVVVVGATLKRLVVELEEIPKDLLAVKFNTPWREATLAQLPKTIQHLHLTLTITHPSASMSEKGQNKKRTGVQVMIDMLESLSLPQLTHLAVEQFFKHQQEIGSYQPIYNLIKRSDRLQTLKLLKWPLEAFDDGYIWVSESISKFLLLCQEHFSLSATTTTTTHQKKYLLQPLLSRSLPQISEMEIIIADSTTNNRYILPSLLNSTTKNSNIRILSFKISKLASFDIIEQMTQFIISCPKITHLLLHLTFSSPCLFDSNNNSYTSNSGVLFLPLLFFNAYCYQKKISPLWESIINLIELTRLQIAITFSEQPTVESELQFLPLIMCNPTYNLLKDKLNRGFSYHVITPSNLYTVPPSV